MRHTVRQAINGVFTARGMMTVFLLTAGAAVTEGCGDVASQDGPSEDSVVQSSLDVSRFQGWNMSQNGGFTSAPGATAVANGVVKVCGLGGDQPPQMYCNTWSNGWSTAAWLPLPSGGFPYNTRPAMTSFANKVAIVVASTEGWPLVNIRDASDMTRPGVTTLNIDWQIFGGNPTQITWLPPAIALVNSSTLYAVIAVDDPATGYKKYLYSYNMLRGTQDAGYNVVNWTNWTEIPGGGRFNSAPAIVGAIDGRVYVVGRGTDNRYWFEGGYSGTIWTGGWTPIGSARFASAPSVSRNMDPNISSYGTAPLNVFGLIDTPADLRIWTASFDGRSGALNGGFTPIAVGATQMPIASTSFDGIPNNNNVYIFVHGSTGYGFWENTWAAPPLNSGTGSGGGSSSGGSGGMSSPCSVSVLVSTATCYNQDGTVSTIIGNGAEAAWGCGPSADQATANARGSLASGGFGTTDQPVAGYCTYTTSQTFNGCFCS